MKRIVLLCLAMCVSLVLAVEAFAEFSDAEKVELVKLHQAGDDVRDALLSIAADAPSEGDRTGHAKAGDRLCTAIRTLQKGLGWYLNVRVGDGSGENALFDDPATTRAQLVEKGVASLDQVDSDIGRAQMIIAALPTSLQVTRAQAALDRAVGRLASFDHALSYADWQPPRYPQQFGPHGDYPRTQATAWNTIVYPIGMIRAGFNAYLDGADPRYLRTLVLRLKDAQSRSSRVMLLHAHVGITAEEQDFTDLQRAFLAIRLFNQDVGGVGGQFFQAQIAALELFQSGSDEVLRKYSRGALADLADGWKAVESWNYWFLNGGLGVRLGF